MSWPTQEQFDLAHQHGTEYALAQRENGATEAREAPLSGEWADDIDWQTVCRNVGYVPDGESYPGGEDASDLADAWERGYFDAWAHSE